MIYGPLFALIICWFWSSAASGQYAGCDYTQSMKFGVSYQIFSPGYSANYQGPVNCRWTSIAPVGSTILINCVDVNIPANAQCNQDRILVSRKGLAGLGDAEAFCGQGTFARYSTSNRLVVALRAPARTVGGRVLCYVEAKPGCQCGLRNSQSPRNTTTRIVGGVETGVNEFPMMAGIVNLRSKDILCGATIISDRHALTAAHCLLSQSISTIALLVGDHDLTTGIDTPHAAVYTLSRLIGHAGFNVATSANDIGLVTTASTIAFNLAVGPACLPFQFTGTTFAGTSVIATGWGTTDFGGLVSQKLRRVSLDVITNAVCRRSYPKLQNMNICTYTSGKDTCQRDSGGPLLWTNPGTGHLYHIGISSYGLYCGGSKPGVSTRVVSYLSWILQNTAGTTFCRPPA